MKREFAVAAADRRLTWLLPGASAVVALLGIGYIATMQPEPWLWLVLPAMLVSFALLAFVIGRARVTLEGGTLIIGGGLLTRRVAVSDLDPAAARMVVLRERDDLRPLLKVFGTHLPGLAMGHFRLRDRSPAFVLVTDRSHVLVLPEKAGAKRRAAKTLLLSLQQPQSLLDALHKTGA
jgi:hypothetical protein